MLQGKNKEIFMPGALTDGHYLMGVACKACHKASFTQASDFQEACIECHGEMRKKPFDSHPKAKFKDPRNADLIDKINVLQCITCHTEHRPDMVHKGGYTQPVDFCIHCHQDIGEDRPSHADMEFSSCNNAGCHNFHNNQALYTDFLVKHLREPKNLEKQILPKKDFASRLEEIATYPHDRYPVRVLAENDHDGADHLPPDEDILHEWLGSAHAKAGVNCSACHMIAADEQSTALWENHPDHRACGQCHDMEVKHFQEGKHGMRLKAGLSPLTPKMARLPMKVDSLNKPLDCTTCHSDHQFDISEAAVDACLGCHDDEHSNAYLSSPHYDLWKKELSGDLPAGSGVSCASCHMPRMDMDVSEWMSRVVVMHNQNATLIPNEKMIRPACLHCHGLEFSINALADDELVQKNFTGQPDFQTTSLELAEQEQQEHEKRRNAQ